VTAASGSLAFTGTGPGLRTVSIVGGALMLLGLLMLVLADIPRRVLRRLFAVGAGGGSDYGGGGLRAVARSARHDAARGARWMLGR
jgi:hypothetical protein